MSDKENTDRFSRRDATKETYVKYPPRKLQSESYSGPITTTQYERLTTVRDQLEKQGFSLGLPTGN